MARFVPYLRGGKKVGASTLEGKEASAFAQNAFQTVVVSGQSDVVADSPTDTLTLVAGANITITTTAGTDAVTIAATGGVVNTANSPNANEFARFTDADTIEGRTAAEVKADLDLEIGTDIQAYDADLTTWAGVTPGTGVATALAVNIGTAGAFVVNGGALGTPSSGTLTNCTFPTLNQSTTGSAATLTTTRTIWGQNFNGSANVSGTLALGVSDLTLTGSIGATGARATKVWTAALESTAMPTVGGTSLSSTFSPIAGSASIVTVGTVTTGTWSATAIAANKGGTGQTTYAVGDLLYASTTSALSKLAGVATGNALISGGVNTAPSWGKIALTTHVSGTLPVANGGTGVTSSTGSGNVVLSASPTFSGTVTTRAISLTGSGGTPDTISFGANSGSAAIWLYDNFPNRVGFGVNSFELQAFMGNSDHFSWNKGGAMQAVGTNEVARLEAVGNFKIGASTARGTTEGTNQIVLFNGTAPAGTLTNGGSIFCAGGEIKVADAAGNITQISPHDNDGNWIHSETNYKGRVLRVDMERLVKAIDKLLGGGFVQEFLIDE